MKTTNSPNNVTQPLLWNGLQYQFVSRQNLPALVAVVLCHLAVVVFVVASPVVISKAGLRIIDISFDANTPPLPMQAKEKLPSHPSEAVATPSPESLPIQQQPLSAIDETQPLSPVRNESSGQPVATPEPDIEPLFKLTRMPSFARKIEAVYPADEKRAGVEARILAEVTIDAQGQVLSLRILKSGGAAFDDAVRESLTRSLFNPGMIDGRAVGTRFQIPFRFSLN